MTMPEPSAGSSLAPFRSAAFAVLWTATVVSNIGTWMSNAASGWLMTELDAAPMVVTLVQVATTLPMFLLALVAGALSDIVDRRRLLIVVNLVLVPVATALCVVLWLGALTPPRLLAFTFVMSAGAAIAAPPWQAIVPALVPRVHLSGAIAANSAGVNISRAVGPAIAGVLITGFGIVLPFALNAISFLGVIGALLWWRPAPTASTGLPPEHLRAALRVGLRHLKSNALLQASLIRAIAFFACASADWALLPLVAQKQVAGGPALYGNLLGAIGAGALIGAFFIQRMRSKFGSNGVVLGGSAGTAASLVLFALAREPGVAFVAGAIAGISWISVLTTLNVAAQVALPDWVRGRGVAMFVTAFFGAMTLGSMIWGMIAQHWGLPAAHLAAAFCILVTAFLTAGWDLSTDSDVDLAPSMHWPAPIVGGELDPDRGPVLVTVEYTIDFSERAAFLAALERLSSQRKSSGAYGWAVYEDAAIANRFTETFYLDSWLDHLRQHHRVTNADRSTQDATNRFDTRGAPKVTHFLAVRRSDIEGPNQSASP
jgi:MFS family permease